MASSPSPATLVLVLPNSMELDPLICLALVDCRPMLMSDAILPARRRLLAVDDLASPPLTDGDGGARKGERDGKAYWYQSCSYGQTHVSDL